MRSIALIFLLFASAGAAAATITIDFEALPLGGSPTPNPGYVEVTTHGFVFTSQVGVSGSGGNKHISGVSFGGLFETPEIWIGREDGQAFSFMSADISGNVLGYFATSSEGNFNNGTGPSLSELGTGAWLNVSSVYLYGAGSPSFTANSIDNVTVGAAVPVPAAVWLFGSALAGLGWLRRKQAV
jgi:hypothetical protein